MFKISFLPFIVMIKPNLTNFTDFIEKPKPVIPKTKYQIQQSINWYLNIIVGMVILIGGIALYLRYKYKETNKLVTIEKLQKFDAYLQENIINEMLETDKNNNR
jgi:hypothetical protein